MADANAPLGAAAGGAAGAIGQKPGQITGNDGDVTVKQDVTVPPPPQPPKPPPGFERLDMANLEAQRGIESGIRDLAKLEKRRVEPNLPEQEKAVDRVPQGAIDQNGNPIPQWLLLDCPQPVDWCSVQPWEKLQGHGLAPAALKDKPFTTIFGFVEQANGQYTLPAWWVKFWGPSTGGYGNCILSVICTITVLMDIAWRCTTRFCHVNFELYWPNVFWSWLTGWLAAWFHFDMREARKTAERNRQYLCPTDPLSADQAIGCALSDDLSYDDALHFGRADDRCEYASRKIWESEQYHLGVGEIQELYRRGEIADAKEFSKRLQQARVWNDDRANQLETLSHSVIGEGQAAELYNRNRPMPGKESPQDEGSKFALIKHLKQAGYTDQDAEKIASLATVPLNERRVEQLYWESLLELDDVTRISQKNGFDDEASGWMKAYGERMLYRHRHSIMGLASPAEISKMYVECVISRQEYTGLMSSLKFTGLEIIYALSVLDKQKVWVVRQNVMSIVEQSLNKMLIDVPTAINNLVAAGLDPVCAKTFIDDEEKANEAKHKCSKLSEAQLCQAVGQGLITYAEFVNALKNCGYQAVDIAVIVDQCKLKAVKEAEDKAKKNQAQKERDRQKAAKAAEQAAKADIGQAKKEVSDVEKAIKAAKQAGKEDKQAAKERIGVAEKLEGKVEPPSMLKLPKQKEPKQPAEQPAETPVTPPITLIPQPPPDASGLPL